MCMDERQRLIGRRVHVEIGDFVRHGTIVDTLTKQETKECLIYGHLFKARMEDTGE